MDEVRPSAQSGDNKEVSTEYANNTMFEATVWDLKLIFGEYSDRTKSVEYHTSITVPWAQAKLMLYHLQVNIAFHEAANGKIKIPEGFIPPEWPPPPAEQANNPKVQDTVQTLQTIRKKFLESLK
jgi:hypothetical protein